MLPILALAIAAFGIGTTEFAVVGLLPDIARDLRVGIPQAGSLVGVYAISVTLGAPIMAALTVRLRRRTALLALMGLFGLGNLLCALSGSYLLLAAARVVTAFSHAAFFGIAAVVAADIAGPGKRGQATAMLFSGLTIANIVGVPAATTLGQAFGWRSAFWAVCGITVIAFAALYRFLPRGGPVPTTRLSHELRALARPAVVLAMAASVLCSASLFALLTFITPVLERVTHVPPHGVALVLLMLGVAFTLGNALGGWLGDWRLLPSVAGCFVLEGIILSIIPHAAASYWPMAACIIGWGLLAFAIGPPLQLQVMLGAKDAPNLASTLNQGAFNLGNATGAWAGAAALAAGWPISHTAYLGVGFCIAGMAVCYWLGRAMTHTVALVPQPP